MSTIRTLRATKYRKQNIYYRQIGELFEYLACIRGEVYTMHIRVRRTFSQRFLGRDYSEKELQDTVNFLAKYAESTVDHVLDQKKSKK